MNNEKSEVLLRSLVSVIQKTTTEEERVKDDGFVLDCVYRLGFGILMNILVSKYYNQSQTDRLYKGENDVLEESLKLAAEIYRCGYNDIVAALDAYVGSSAGKCNNNLH